MGQIEQFCTGCQDCTNLRQTEGDLSNFANQPILKISRNFNDAENTNVANFTMNDNSVFGVSDYNKNKDESFTAFSEIKNDNSENYNHYQSNRKEYEQTKLNRDDLITLNEIKKNYNAKLLTKYFRKFRDLKNEAHQILYKEYSFISGSEYMQSDPDNSNELDVDLVPDKNYLYLGTKFNNKKDGLGLEVFSDSDAKYFGYFLNGKRVYLGNFIINNSINSYSYKGEINGLFADGFGINENKNNSTYYEGYWKKSKKNGYGIEIYKDKSIYKGCFLNGKKHGIGFYDWNDNSNYMGEWAYNMLEGYGIYNFKDGSIYKGLWKNNRMDGLGEFTYPGVKSYIGFFEKDKRAGFGILIWYKESKAFIGFWEENKQNGYGKFIANNKIKMGYWENAKLKNTVDDENELINKLNIKDRYYAIYFRLDDYEDILKKIQKIIK